MHVAIRRYTVEPEIYRDLKDRLEDDFVPRLKHVSGFVGYYAIKTGSDTLDTVSVFETEAGEKESNELAVEFVKRNYPQMKIKRVSLDEGACIIEHHRTPARA